MAKIALTYHHGDTRLDEIHVNGRRIGNVRSYMMLGVPLMTRLVIVLHEWLSDDCCSAEELCSGKTELTINGGEPINIQLDVLTCGDSVEMSALKNIQTVLIGNGWDADELKAAEDDLMEIIKRHKSDEEEA
jgi:hypothetical protein